ncbi:MAG: cytochrome c peroxidase [Pseudomonadota bacterium]|mgnify:FL=1|nr:methylamine utilization protein MauG [Gammaproteobacteria bacterium]MEC8859483.1 cytochrome c peroxidase [Pseudomonadota bacterium]HBN15361.1 methylamine utilization protein MauG [Pseudohongiella sp.]|tara:strand:- start:3659 stop:4822 length:1164 start_codon:yes stop_codon:yes gene_type:complete
MMALRRMVLGLLVATFSSSAISADDSTSLAWLGQAFFFDTNLSLERTLSCATCHDPNAAFSDPRDNGVLAAASLGSDGVSLGDRHAPSLGYVALTPEFSRDADGLYHGGLFWDGRANNLAEQALVPIFDQTEMRLSGPEQLAERVLENPDYRRQLVSLFGDQIETDPEQLSKAVGKALAAFQQTEQLQPFDSPYDDFLRGEYQPTLQESLGMALFFTEGFTNCNQCHQLQDVPNRRLETFSNYAFENIGLPVNERLRSVNRKRELANDPEYKDKGLAMRPDIPGGEQDGRFKVPSLRNVAVTGPYMHNGVFSELRTVLDFYNKYNRSGGDSQINPETGEPWGDAEVPETIAMDKLTGTMPLEPRHLDALEAFLRMLTDKRYQHLLED